MMQLLTQAGLPASDDAMAKMKLELRKLAEAIEMQELRRANLTVGT